MTYEREGPNISKSKGGGRTIRSGGLGFWIKEKGEGEGEGDKMMASAATSSVVVVSSFFRKQLPPPPTTLSSVTARRPIGGGRGMIVVAKTSTRRENRIARHVRIRKKVEGTTERPRLCVFRSNKNIFVQVIDDSKMHTLASAGTMMKSMAGEFDYTSGPTIEAAKKVGAAIAKACLDKGIDKVVFDRGGYPYHGRVKALAEAARENGLSF